MYERDRINRWVLKVLVKIFSHLECSAELNNKRASNAICGPLYTILIGDCEIEWAVLNIF